MLLRAVGRYLRANVVMKLELDHTDPSMFIYDKLCNHVPNNCATANALTLLNTKGACKTQRVPRYSIPDGVPLQQMRAVINIPAIASKEIPVPAQAPEEIPIAEANNNINTVIDSMLNEFETWTFHRGKPNEPR